MPLGIVSSNMSPQGFTLVTTEWWLLPVAASAAYASAVTSITAATQGTVIPLTAGGTVPLRQGRLPTINSNDASGTTLTLSVTIVGRRFGRQVVQTLTRPANTSGAQLTTGTLCIDEFVSATITSITNNAASDTVSIGIDGTRLGLMAPIKSIKSVKLIEKIAGGSPATDPTISTAGIRVLGNLQLATRVFPRDSSIDVNALFAGAVTSADRYMVQYLSDGLDEFRNTGKWS